MVSRDNVIYAKMFGKTLLMRDARAYSLILARVHDHDTVARRSQRFKNCP